MIEGRHNLEVRGLDASGNTGSSTVKNWLVDITAPTSAVAELNASYQTTGFNVNWGGTDTDASGATSTASGIGAYDIQYKIGAGEWQSWINVATSTGAIFNIMVAGGQTVYFRSRASDLAGNQENWPAEDNGDARTVITGGDNGEELIADHLVVSQAQTAGATPDYEFIEIYNPTDSDIALNGYSLQYRGSAAENFYKKDFLAGSKVKAKSYYLAASDEYGGEIEPDFVYAGFNLSGAGGTIFLVNNTEILNDANATSSIVIDRLSYGAGPNLFPESSVAAAPAAGKSLIRKASATSTAESLAGSGLEAVSGNGYDTDDNSRDFIVLAVPEPKNAPRNRVAAGNLSTFFTGGGQRNYSWLHEVSGNDPVLVVSFHGDGASIHSVSYGGQPMAQAASKVINIAFNNLSVYTYVLANPPSGINSITVDAEPISAAISAVTLNNCDISDPLSYARAFEPEGTNPIEHAAETEGGDMLIDAVTFNKSIEMTVTAGTGQTQYYQKQTGEDWVGQTNGLYAADSYKPVARGGTQSMSWLADPARHAVHSLLVIKRKP